MRLGVFFIDSQVRRGKRRTANREYQTDQFDGALLRAGVAASEQANRWRATRRLDSRVFRGPLSGPPFTIAHFGIAWMGFRLFGRRLSSGS